MRTTRFGLVLFACLMSAVFLVSRFRASAEDPATPKPEAELLLRRPVALAEVGDRPWLFVANRRSGTISVIDTATRRTVGETAVGRRLADLAALPDGRHLRV